MKAAVFAFFCLVLLLSGCAVQNENAEQRQTACVENGKCLNLRIADSAQEREQGLMFEKSLPENEGMLFVFDEPGIYGFWMKSTLIPLDMLWLDQSGKIVFIKENARPCKDEPCGIFTPDAGASFVLETNAGFAQRNGLEKGGKIALTFG